MYLLINHVNMAELLFTTANSNLAHSDATSTNYHYRNTSTPTTSPIPPRNTIAPPPTTANNDSSTPRSITTTRISPGLQLRLRRLDEQTRLRLLADHNRRRDEEIGRIPEEQLAELEQRVLQSEQQQQQQNQPGVSRAGNSWTPTAAAAAGTPGSGPPPASGYAMPASGGVRLDGGPVLSEPSDLYYSSTAEELQSDAPSSPISLGTRLVPSDSEEDMGSTGGHGRDDEEEDALRDDRKYRMPDVGKTRLNLRTKEPLSPTPRQVRADSRRESLQSTPVTPREGRRSSTAGADAGALAESSEVESSPSAGRGGGHGYGGGGESAENVSDSDWVGSGLSRAGSIYSLGRASFTGQLTQLTSMKLPDADSLARRISSMPTAAEAAKALSDATEQIMLWIGKASEALSGLNAEDDVDWAAAGGREGIDDVDGAINRFEKLVQVYIVAIEKLQTRDDVKQLSASELNGSVKQLEGVIMAWNKIKQTLKGVKEQVEVAMEWEELWSSVLGEIAQEMEALNRLVFEMEEKRHEGAESLLSTKENLDISELETIVEERPGRGRKAGNRFSVLPPFSPSSPLQPSENTDSKEDASLLALFARMQPLRASLDFLPMRLSTFHIRGNAVFPTACEDLEKRRVQLEDQWKKLEDDSEALRRELGEDRWVLVFRNAGKQALKMCESVSRSFSKLKEGIDTGEHQFNMAGLSKKIENYEAKVQHYGPAIERVLAIIDKGVLDRLTVNGEILRLQSDMKRRWATLQGDIRDMELVLGDINNEARERQLRDSVSTVMSSERSIGSSLLDTPGSSPASSVNVSRKSSFQGSRTPTPLNNGKTRKTSFTTSSASRTTSRIPSSSSSAPRRTPLTHSIYSDLRGSPSPSPSIAVTPPSGPISKLSWTNRNNNTRPADNRPRWSSVGKYTSTEFAPLSKYEPSPYAKAPITPKPYMPRQSTAPTSGRRTPFGTRIVSEPTPPPPSQQQQHYARPPSAAFSRGDSSSARKSSLPVPSPFKPTSTPSARSASALATRRPPSSLRAQRPSFSSANTSSSAMLSTKQRRSSMLPVPPSSASFRDGNDADSESAMPPASVGKVRRPPSALAMAGAGASGRRSSAAVLGRARSRLDDGGDAEKARWR